MALNGLQKLLAGIDARVAFSEIVLRALVQRAALTAPDPREYATALFADISGYLDQIDEARPPRGDYSIEIRKGVRRASDEFAAKMARDIGLAAPGKDTGG